MTYQHTQRGHIDTILYVGMFAMLIVALAWHAAPGAFYGFALLAGIFFVLALAFAQLTVRDAGDQLVVQYGPLPLFRKRIRYADITAARGGRSHWIDGWGIHYVPGRGWTYNLWGFDCVELELGSKKLRIGTDDRANLLALVESKIDAG